MQVSGKDTCGYFDVSTLAPLALYDFHEGLCGLPPAFPAAPDDDDDDPTDQGPHSAEYLAPCLLAILTAFGALRCIDPRLFSRRLAKVSWSDVSFCAFLPAMVAYVGYYAALMPRIFVDASVPSWPEHVIVVELLAVLAATALFLRHFLLAPSKAAKSKWVRCYLGIAVGFAVVVPLVAPLAMASSYWGRAVIGGGEPSTDGQEVAESFVCAVGGGSWEVSKREAAAWRYQRLIFLALLVCFLNGNHRIIGAACPLSLR